MFSGANARNRHLALIVRIFEVASCAEESLQQQIFFSHRVFTLLRLISYAAP